ncbi:MAG: hypothetical protein IJT70_03795 [Clostridia bacterium]|nr:hypothetical protein [Clostridia bacterium]
MKKILALVLCAVMLLGPLSSCTTLVGDDKGAEIDIYLSGEIYDFDPTTGFEDVSKSKYLSLIFEGLTRLDENGNWEYALMDEYDIVQDDEECFKIDVTLRETKWSDARRVQANDVVYAWKRILDPEFKCEAGSLLYDIKNAYDVKMGDASIDDLGASAIDTYILEIEFEKKIDLDEFFKKCASIALVPLREDIVSINPNWAKKASTLITNGPFDIKELKTGEMTRLERSAYYYRDTSENGALDEYVIPYRLRTHYDYGDLDEQLEAFLSGKIFYVGEIPLDRREEFAEYANVSDYPATHAYYFNEKNPLFENENVRRALSIALDREEIAKIVYYASPATGFVPPIVKDVASDTYFRDGAGDLIQTTADLSGAKDLLRSAGVTEGEFSISIRDREVDYAVAEYAKGVWEQLGFTVRIERLSYATDAENSTIVIDKFGEAYLNGDYDVIAVDAISLATDPSEMLATFAKKYSGYGVNMEPEDERDENGEEVYNYDLKTHSTGFDDPEYEALFDEYFAEEDVAAKTDVLRRAEKMLIDKGVVAPLYFMKDSFLFSDILSKLDSIYFGRRFNGMKMDNYMAYKADAEELSDEDE